MNVLQIFQQFSSHFRRWRWRSVGGSGGQLERYLLHGASGDIAIVLPLEIFNTGSVLGLGCRHQSPNRELYIYEVFTASQLMHPLQFVDFVVNI
jgi:hypothetical protein